MGVDLLLAVFLIERRLVIEPGRYAVVPAVVFDRGDGEIYSRRGEKLLVEIPVGEPDSGIDGHECLR